jgi:hypothetical protein
MVGKKGTPNLEDALEISFSELKVGEENIQLDEKPGDEVKEIPSSPEYGLKINSEETRVSFISKPITGKKETKDEVLEEKPVLKDSRVLDSPTSKIGDDFAVDW